MAIHNTYEELAEVCDRQQEARQRDIFLVLAADAAFRSGRRDEAERLRRRLLALSPHSLFRPYDSFAEALQSGDILDYLADLRRLFPPEQATKLLHGNGKNGAATSPVYRFQDENKARAAAVPLPPPTTPRRDQSTSPYERFEVPLPGRAGDAWGFDAWGRWLAILLYFLAFAGAVSLTAYVLLRPFIW
ncbi:MAG: hypothetical protein L0Y71_15325 [Gemmataceae bacterium]|nr:hypothetical protein [Gemmataceae bacterium]